MSELHQMIVLHEKHGDRYIDAGSTKESLEEAAASVVSGRLADGYWYDEPMTAQDSIDHGWAKRFLLARSSREYEGVSFEVLAGGADGVGVGYLPAK